LGGNFAATVSHALTRDGLHVGEVDAWPTAAADSILD